MMTMLPPPPLLALLTAVVDAIPPSLHCRVRRRRRRRRCLCSIVFADLPNEALDAILAATAKGPAAKGCETVILLLPLGGAIARVPAESTAFGHRAAKYWMVALAKFPDAAANPKPREAVVRWTRALRAAVAPWVAGSYNTLAALEGSEFIAYGKG